MLLIILVFVLAMLAIGLIYWQIFKFLEHEEMLMMALRDYLVHEESFDISIYPDITEEELRDCLNRMNINENEDMKKHFSDNPDSVFDEEM